MKDAKFTATMTFNADKELVQELRTEFDIGEKEMMTFLIHTALANRSDLEARVANYKEAIEAVKAQKIAEKEAEKEAEKAEKLAAKEVAKAEKEAAMNAALEVAAKKVKASRKKVAEVAPIELAPKRVRSK
jgi:hypothetical protein